MPNFRYTVEISFKKFVNDKFTGHVAPLIERCKTLSEALLYRDLIDESVDKASITDNVTKKTIVTIYLLTLYKKYTVWEA